MSSSDEQPRIDHNPLLQSYYASFESRIGYRIVLGGTRHFGYYKSDTWWPFPIGQALRAMEDHLFRSLNLEPGAEVLDAGCGVGHVATHLAKKGLRVQGIDVVDRHISKAHHNVKASGIEDAVTVRKADYHHLDAFSTESLDGVYTMETFVHATDPAAALSEFFRVLKPGGSLALYEYDHIRLSTAPKELAASMEKVNQYAAMPANAIFDQGVLPSMLEDAGFEDVRVTNLSVNIRPMLRLFFALAFFPYIVIKLFHLEAWFINTVAGFESYRGHSIWRYIAVTAKKPVGRASIHALKKVQ